jgi:hypothetical protein
MLPRLPILVAVACTLFLRAMVPAGWMPAASGAFAIEPCPAAKPSQVIQAGSHHHGKHDRSHKDSQSGDCGFAPLGNAYAHNDVAAAAPPAILISGAVPQSLAAPSLKTGPPALPPPSTGPPSIA